MKLNCREGDLAFIVFDETPRDIGKIVRVRTFVVDEDGWACWLCDSDSPLGWYDDNNRRRYSRRNLEIPDEWLRPIRDPGDSARDESLSWLPAPNREGVTA